MALAKRTDAAWRARCAVLAAALAVCGWSPAFAQGKRKPAAPKQNKPAGGSAAHSRPQPAATITPEVEQAELAIERNEYAQAESLLTKATSEHAEDYRAWYDLGYAQNALGKPDAAIGSYRKAVALKADIFEANLNLGILLAKQGQPDAETFLRNATQLKPSARPEEGWERAWLSLGHVLEKKDAAAALEAYAKAAQLQPRDAEPHLSAGALLEAQKDFAAAEKEFRSAAELDPKSNDALAGVVNAATKGGNLAGAEAALRQYLQVNPDNAAAQAQLGRVLALENKPEAVAHLEDAVRVNPSDADLRRELAVLYLKNKEFAKAEAMLRPLAQSQAADATVHRMLGAALLQQLKVADAQGELLQAVKLDPRMADAYGDLATAAYKNKNYPLAIQALDARGRLEPDSPGAYFLRAQAYDQLQNVPMAVANYKQFLLVANGRFPDQEWQARHRLIAIDPDARKKK